MSIGFLTIEEGRSIGCVRNSVIKFARNEWQYVRWFTEGQLQFNDLVITIQPIHNGCAVDVAIRCWGNNDIIPVEKEIPCNGGEEFATIVSGNKIEIKELNGIIKITANHQSRDFKLDKSLIVLAVRLGKVVFFSNDKNQTDKALKGGMFSAYIDREKTIYLDEFFEKEMVNALISLTADNPKAYANKGGQKVCLERHFVNEHQGGELYSVGDVEDYFQLMKDDFDTYNKLYYENELKLHENQLDNVARLKGFGQNILEINQKFEKVCHKNVTIVLTGESGTGKTYFAKQIHNNSKRSGEPFISVNCAAIAPNLIESELFGYEDGAFTGAKKGGKPGYFEMANGGTLFLDEISELPTLLQGKLLEVLQENTFYRVGGTKKISVDIRLIVATNKNLEKMVQDGLFREDLYYRINVFPIHLPPLRERTQDMYSIIEDTLPIICRRLDMEVPLINHEAMMEIQRYSWPGNIRELENVLEKAAVMSENNVIKKEDIVIGNTAKGGQVAKTLKEKVNEYEKIVITEAYERFDGNRKKMEEYLGISKTNLFEKIHKYGLAQEEE